MAEQKDAPLIDLSTQSTSPSATEGAPPQKECPKFLDLAFAMDCTGSMGSYIHSAQRNIRSIVEQIVSEEKADVRLALVEYRDHPPQDQTFVTKVHDFTQSVRAMKGWLDGCSASGGGDQAEAVADALHQVLKLSWRDEATKVCVFIADAPPHGLGSAGDGFPNGSPNGLDPMEITNQLAEKQISLYMVGCEPSIIPFKDFFMSLSHLTGGQYVPLASAQLLAKVITGGVQEQISLQQLMADVNQEVLSTFSDQAEDVKEEDLTKLVHEKLKKKGVKSKRLVHNDAELPEASVVAQQMSSCVNMGAVRDMWSKSNPSSSVGGFSFGGGVAMSAPRRVYSPACGPPPMAAPGSDPVMDRFLSPMSVPPMNMSAPPMNMSAPPMNMSAPPMNMMAGGGASGVDSYDCKEDDISEAQVQRMVQQSVWSNKLKGRYNKKH